jgi:hypothetical protein
MPHRTSWPPANPHDAVEIGKTGQTGLTRQSDTDDKIGFAINAAPGISSIVSAGINLTAEGLWNTITGQVWNAAPGCSSHAYLWAPNSFVSTTPTVDAMCTGQAT